MFCEKPLTLTKADALRATEACREAGIVLGIGTDKRFFPAMAALAQIAASGELGRLLHIEGNFSNEVAAKQFSAWRDSSDESPAGGLTGTGIHVLDSFVHIAGPVRRVTAQLLSHKPPPDPLDTLSVLLEFASRRQRPARRGALDPGLSGGCMSLGATARPRRSAAPS